MYIPNFKSPKHQEACFYTVKYCKIAIFCTFLSCQKNQYNDMKLYMDKLTGMKNLHVRFQVSGLSGSMFLYCKILQDSDFLYFFWAWLLQKSGHWHEFLQGQTSGDKKRTFQISISRTSGSLFLYSKILQNCNSFFLFDVSCHKNQYNDMKLYMDKPTGMKNLHAKFQVSQSLESMFLCCSILQDGDFLYLFLSVAPTKIKALSWNFSGANKRG